MVGRKVTLTLRVGNCEVTPEAMLPTAKSLMKRDGPKAPTAVHGPLRTTHLPKEKANAIADCLEFQLTSPDLCHENHERRVEARVQALIASVEDTPLEKVGPCDIQKIVSH
jgi:hypothetical protein